MRTAASACVCTIMTCKSLAALPGPLGSAGVSFTRKRAVHPDNTKLAKAPITDASSMIKLCSTETCLLTVKFPVQARPTSAVAANVALQSAAPEHESQPLPHLESMQLPSSSLRADPDAQEHRGQQHTAPGHDACMQKQQHQQLPCSSQPVDPHAQERRGMQRTAPRDDACMQQQQHQQLPSSSQQVVSHAQERKGMQRRAPGDDACMQQRQQQLLLQAALRLPGRAARAVAVIRGPEEAAVCIRQLHDTLADRIPSRQFFYQKAQMGES